MVRLKCSVHYQSSACVSQLMPCMCTSRLVCVQGLQGSLEYIDYTYKTYDENETETMRVGASYNAIVIALSCMQSECCTNRRLSPAFLASLPAIKEVQSSSEHDRTASVDRILAAQCRPEPN